METERFNPRIRFIIRRSPLLLALAVLWMLLAWRHEPISVPYLVSCVGVGLLCGGLIFLDYWKNPSPLLPFLAMMIFISAPIFLDAFFFPNLDRSLANKMSYQYISAVLASVLGLIVLLRHKIMRSLAHADVEQIVGRERRERVSHHNWSGDA